jgi:hypothetical protein
MTTPSQPEPFDRNHLEAAFQDQPLSNHPSQWDGLWAESFTPWDRGEPSVALQDLLSTRPDLFPEADKPARPTALVPGCGRGYDVLLLSAFGYDVIGLDYSAVATREAIENEQRVGGDDMYAAKRPGTDKGSVTWITGDFWDDAWLVQTGKQDFDLIFDYTVGFPVYASISLVHI